MGTVARETVGTDWRAVFLDVSRWIGSVFLGVFGAIGGLIVASLAVGSPSGGTLLLAAAVGGAVPFCLLVVLGTLTTLGTEVRLYSDRAEVSRGPPFGTTELPYHDVAMAVRSTDFTDDRFGVSTFEFVREDADTVTVQAVERPDDVEAHLDDHLPSADEWLREHGDGDTALHATMRRRWWLHRYHLWEAYHDDAVDDADVGEWVEEADWYDAVDVPFDAEQPGFVMVDMEEPDADPAAAGDGVVEPDDLAAITGVDFADTDLDELGEADGIDDVGDIDSADLGGASDDAGDGGGDFDGGDI